MPVCILRRLLCVQAAIAALVMLLPLSAYAANNAAANNGAANNNNFNFGTQPAGVLISADGVLRMKLFTDTGVGARRMQEARVKLNADLAKPSKLRKVSLTRLEAVLADHLAKGDPIPEDMKYLAGLTRLEYIFYYPDTKDIVIAGPAEGFAADASGRVIGMTTGRAVLELQDLVTALRAFGPNGRAQNLISVSIDPTADGLKKMQNFLKNLGRITPSDDQRIAAGLRDNLGLQTVSVLGVPAQTHFAQVLVEADYRMKLIGIGIEKPAVKISAYVDKANPRDVSRNAMQRWYFTPNYECVRLSEDKLAAQLVGDGVQLIGANELVNNDGGRVGTNVVDAASKAFTTSFTQNYGALALKSPVYAQMRNLIDLSIAAALIQQQDYYAKADWRMELLGDEKRFPVETYETPKTVETAVNVIWKGGTLMTPVGGGVQIYPTKAIEPSYLLKDDKGAVAKLRAEIEFDKLGVNQWWWD